VAHDYHMHEESHVTVYMFHFILVDLSEIGILTIANDYLNN
jgi:hypothetical protein